MVPDYDVDLMARNDTDRPTRRPKTWGKRPYATKEAREMLNDVTSYISRTRPDWVDDPDDPSLDDVIRTASKVYVDRDTDPKAVVLADLMGHGLTFKEAV